MSPKFYELSHNLDRFRLDNVYEFGDGYLANKFNNWEDMDLAFFKAIPIILEGSEGLVMRQQNKYGNWYTSGAKMPLKILFSWNHKDYLSNQIDYPYFPDVRSWPVISRRMLDVLLSVGDFSHQVIPVIFTHIDGLLPNDQERQKASLLIRNNDFIILQLTEYFDGLDRDRTEYTSTFDDFDPKLERIDITGKMVLKEPYNGFPPIFRVKEDRVSLYVSAEAKEALEKAGIQGLDFSSWNLGSS